MHEPAAKETLIKLLPQLHPAELLPQRERLVSLTEAQSDLLRHHAWAAIVTAEESFDSAWRVADSNSALGDLLAAVPLVYDPFIRARAHEKVMPLLSPDTAHDAIRPIAIRAAASTNREHAAVFAALATLIERGRDVPTAAAAMRMLPVIALDPRRCAGVAATLVAWAADVPVDKRTSDDFLAAVQLAETLIVAMPADQARPLLSQLRDLRVAAFVVAAVPEQMRFDTSRIVVEAGKPVQITLVNNDLMPHNLVVVLPGERARIGQLAMTMKPDQLDSAGRAYVPVDHAVLAATKMIDPGTRETLSFTAPETEGEYEYVCTYPDHWQVMWGKLIVTKDVEASLRGR